MLVELVGILGGVVLSEGDDSWLWEHSKD